MFARILIVIVALVLLVPPARCAAAGSRTDVVVYGGTSAGIAAAVQAARMGRSVVVVAPETHLGGLSAGGLGWTDTGKKEAIGGIAREFYHRVWKHYQQADAWRWQKPEEFGNKGQGTPAIDGENRTMWIFEPHVAEAVFEGFVKEHQITVVRDAWLDRAGGVEKREGSISAIRTLKGDVFRGKVFIDATYEGDLMAAAGVSYHVGREPAAAYGEQWNGVQTGVLHHRHHFMTDISPYRTPGDPASGLLPRISAEPPGEYGAGDKRLQAYCYRMCLTDHPKNRVPFPKPEGYDAGQYELLLRVLESGWREQFDKFDLLPNRKTDTNNHGPFSTDNIGMNYDYPEASYARRREILKEHETYQKGLLYFMANDRACPGGCARIAWQNGASPWTSSPTMATGRTRSMSVKRGACSATSRHDRARGARQARRAQARRHGLLRDGQPQCAALCEAGRLRPERGRHRREPRRSPTASATARWCPKRRSANLLVPVCVSSSHIAFGSIRMEPVFMILGQSAATAASLAIESDIAVQDVSYERLRERLLQDDQRLSR
jgi:hypothetical protein